MCPGLRDLALRADPETLPFHRRLISQKLTSFTLTFSPSFLKSMEEQLSIIQPVITRLDTFPLQRLRVHLYIPEACIQTESVVSLAVLRCGPALKALAMDSPLSNAALRHIMQLPNLDAWHSEWATEDAQSVTIQHLPPTQPSVASIGSIIGVAHLLHDNRTSHSPGAKFPRITQSWTCSNAYPPGGSPKSSHRCCFHDPHHAIPRVDLSKIDISLFSCGG